MQRLLTAIVSFDWLILLAVLPLILFPTPTRSLALLVIPCLWLVRKGRDGRFIPVTPLDISLLFLLVTILVSLYASYDLTFSLPKVIGVIYGIALFYAVANAASQSSRHLQVGLAIFLLAGLAIVAISLIGTNWGSKLPGFASLTTRIPQLLHNVPSALNGFSPNEVAGTLLWFVPLSLALALSPRALGRSFSGALFSRFLVVLFLWVAALLSTFTFLLSQSRSGYLALAAASLVILWYLLHQRKLLAWGLFILIFGLSIGLVSLVGWRQIDQLFFAFSGDAVSEEGVTLTGRTEVWVRAVYAIQDFPLTGMGMNLFRYVVPVLYPFFTIANDVDIAHAHNQFLQAGVDLGIPGLIAYLAIWLGLGGMLWRSWRLSIDSWSQVLIVGFAASLLGSFVFGMTDAVALGAKPGFMFWSLMGLVTGHYRLLDGVGREDNDF